MFAGTAEQFMVEMLFGFAGRGGGFVHGADDPKNRLFDLPELVLAAQDPVHGALEVLVPCVLAQECQGQGLAPRDEVPRADERPDPGISGPGTLTVEQLTLAHEGRRAAIHALIDALPPAEACVWEDEADIDGFNLYHGLRSKGWKKYYWLDLWALAERFLRPGQTLADCLKSGDLKAAYDDRAVSTYISPSLLPQANDEMRREVAAVRELIYAD